MKALIIVDMQNDFMPGGALAVKEGDEIIPIINAVQAKFDCVIATQDWHPINHGSFASNHRNKVPGEFVDLFGVNQILWPEHCIQGTFGAKFHGDLHVDRWKEIFRKGKDATVDSYSGFFDNKKGYSTGLSEYLKNQGIKEIYVCGLATDYCVKFTVLDGISEGFKTFLIEDATKAVELNVGDRLKAVEEMKSAGASIIQSTEI
jgi:nicotinamidase/pyrazinamidase